MLLGARLTERFTSRACAGPKPFPEITTAVPARPDIGERLVMFGVPVTVNSASLLHVAPAVTNTLPVLALCGTTTESCALDQLLTIAGTPLNRTWLDPCEVPKFAPVIVTGVPAGPALGDKFEMIGRTCVLLPTVTAACPQIEPVQALRVTWPAPIP